MNKVFSNHNNLHPVLCVFYFFYGQRGLSYRCHTNFFIEKRVPVVIDTPEIVVEVEYKIILDVYLLEKVYQEAFNPNSKVLGRKPLSGFIEGKVTCP